MEPVRDERRTWDADTVDRMVKLRRARQTGMFHEVAEDMFPPENSGEQLGDEQPRADG